MGMTCDNPVCSVCNKVGFAWFNDQSHRYILWGGALVIYLVGLVCACVAVAGLSESTSVVQNTYWAKYTVPGNNNRNDSFTGATAYINVYGIYLDGGNQSLNNHGCPADGCTTGMCSYDDLVNCLADDSEYRDSTFFSDCKDQVGGFTFLVIMMLVTMAIKAISTFSRMFQSSDSSFQKCKGLIVSVVPMILQTINLILFNKKCYGDIRDDANPEMGPGYWCGVVVIICNLPIFFLHILTPVPEKEQEQLNETASELGAVS